jgi:hypothetical protein
MELKVFLTVLNIVVEIQATILRVVEILTDINMVALLVEMGVVETGFLLMILFAIPHQN